MFRRRFSTGWAIFVWASVAILLVWSLFPIFWMVSTSLKTDLDVFKNPPEIWPMHPTMQNYIGLTSGINPIPQFFFNSFFTALLTVVLTIVLATFAGYALSRLKFRFRDQILISVLVTQMFPLVVMLAPLYLLYVKAHLLNTYFGMVIAFTSFALPFGIWMIKGFIDSVPVEVEQAAMVDGCSRMQAMRIVVLPLITPGIVATGIFAFLDAWNNLLFPLTLTNEITMKTLPAGMVLAFAGQFKSDWGGMMAASFITTLPVLVIFILLQRYLVEGLTGGAVKG
ncbi:carbohydrate ABC transporter permease [Desulfosporosinus sp. PR]|uniref:carbohydrate ABC transporter permease n=1 Tax=Candidatus Desulfosporosinus nitrosoreducens TaxID=3401928 RepID=UPI0027FCF9FE|nr:carbohydrate ABC transporter permease [Desulfosporosinus sp. PR]MDQ7095320.1 carbohydrate ABC transporter permease [Desulfosporosinus sp. PR]